MLDLPATVLDYIYTIIVENRSLAYLLVQKDGRLSRWGGNLSAYGFTELQQGEYVREQVFFLEGLLPLDNSPIFLPCIKTEYGQCCDVHLFPADEGDWVLLLDATLDEIQRRLIQQQGNDLSLLRQEHSRISNQFGEMMNELIPAALSAALPIVIMERLDDASFRMIGTVPDWFVQFYPDAALEREKLLPAINFPFIENFLLDAENFWMENGAGILKSGLWSEIDISGNECHLEALAVCWNNQKILLISLVEIAAYEEKELIIQKARKNKLNFHYLFKELQKKELFIHCIVHDLAGQITGIKYCFELLALQNLTPKGKQYLEIGRKQSTGLEMLSQDILNAFSADLESLDAFTIDPAQAPDALICAREVVNALLPNFSLNKINLQLNPDIDMSGDWKVVGDKSRLERVLSNLVENALRHSPPNSTVTVDLQQEGEFILLTVDDEGSGVPQDISKHLFEKFAQGKDKAGRAGLGLYFCRITVEHWGGTIGYSPRESGGSRFWFRLPKPVLPLTFCL